MGTTYFNNIKNKSALIAEIVSDGGREKCIKHSCYGNELWTIFNINGNKIIILYLLSQNKGSWGYKDIAECEGPYYYNCPLSYIKEVPVTNQNWRDRVISHHEMKAKLKKINIGDTVVLQETCTPNKLVVTGISPLVGEHDGLQYSIKKFLITEVL